MKDYKDINLYDAICSEIGYSKDNLKFILHNNKILIGIKFDGDIDTVNEFLTTFTDPTVRVPKDITCRTRKVLLNGEYVESKDLIDNANTIVMVGDYIFRSHNDYHFFMKHKEDVEADDDNYIEIPFELACSMLEQITYPTKEEKTVVYDSYFKAFNEISRGYAIKYTGTSFTGKICDVGLAIIAEKFDLINTYTDGDFSTNYAPYRFKYYTDHLSFLVKYNFTDKDKNWQMYCDFPNIEVYPVYNDNLIVFGYYNGNTIMRVAKNDKEARRLLNSIREMDKYKNSKTDN